MAVIKAGKSGVRDSTHSSFSVLFLFLTLNTQPVDSRFLFLTPWDVLKLNFFKFYFILIQLIKIFSITGIIRNYKMEDIISFQKVTVCWQLDAKYVTSYPEHVTFH